jgi:transcriptional regulator with XRE-family HTH domain
VSAPDYQRTLGRKIAAERKRRGLSQQELARMIGRSVAWVSQVERGVRRIDRMSVLETLATALDLPLAELAADAPIMAAAEDSPSTTDLRLVLSGVHSLGAMLGGPNSASADDLRARTATAWELAHASRCTELADLLTALIPDLETAARVLPGQVFELVAAAYQACSAALDKLGDPEAAWVAADRAMMAAERADSPFLVAAGAFRLVFVFISARHYDQAEATARTALTRSGAWPMTASPRPCPCGAH